MEAVNEFFEDQNSELYFEGFTILKDSTSWSTGGQSAMM
jgi:hypothetical protein